MTCACHGALLPESAAASPGSPDLCCSAFDAAAAGPTVHSLLENPEVEAFKKHKWGGGPIPLFYGAMTLTDENVEAWEG